MQPEISIILSVAASLSSRCHQTCTRSEVLNICFTSQAQCQKDLGKLNKEVEIKESELSKAQTSLHQQQNTETALQKRIAEAERRLQVCSSVMQPEGVAACFKRVA